MSSAPSNPIDFLVVGAQKAGTTTFRHYLGLHSQIGLHAALEPHFFDNEAEFKKSAPDYAAYHAGFPPPRESLKRGEVTPIYMYWKPAIERIKKYNPAIQLIAILRNPVERAFSAWTMERNRGAESLSFYDALIAEKSRPKTYSHERRVHFYAERGRYTEQIRRLWQNFDRSQVLILRSEELYENPKAVMYEVCEFLQICSDPYREFKSRRLRAGRYFEQMDYQSARYLHSVFDAEIRELEELLGWDLRAWFV